MQIILDGMLNLSSYFLENVCWLKDRAWYYGFLLPVGIILVGNFIVFFLVTYELNKQSVSKRLSVFSMLFLLTKVFSYITGHCQPIGLLSWTVDYSCYML